MTVQAVVAGRNFGGMNTSIRRPLVPEDLHRNGNAASRSFWRGITSTVMAVLEGRQEPPEKFCQRAWSHDREAAQWATRAATTPATSATMADLRTIGVGPVLVSLAPASAAASLQANALQLDFTRVYQNLIPRIDTAPTATWVGEAGAANMLQPVLGSVLVGPVKKLLFGCALTAARCRSRNPTVRQRKVTA